MKKSFYDPRYHWVYFLTTVQSVIKNIRAKPAVCRNAYIVLLVLSYIILFYYEEVKMLRLEKRKPCSNIISPNPPPSPYNVLMIMFPY